MESIVSSFAMIKKNYKYLQGYHCNHEEKILWFIFLKKNNIYCLNVSLSGQNLRCNNFDNTLFLMNDEKKDKKLEK